MTPKAESRGCLSVLFPFLRQKQASQEEYEQALQVKPAPEVSPYRLRDDFLSPAELSFYKVLSAALGEGFVVQSKVRLADIFFVARSGDYMRHFNRISQRHVDFLVCDADNMKPLCGVELDDASHRRKARQARDKLVEQVFQAAKFPLVRFPVQQAYNTREVAARIGQAIRAHASSGETAASPAPQTAGGAKATDAPLCPKCGIPMVVRTVTRGKHKGKQFYGCVNYPRCREVKPLSVRKVV